MGRWALLLLPLLWVAPSGCERCAAEDDNTSCYAPLLVEGVAHVGYAATGIPLEGPTVRGEIPPCDPVGGCATEGETELVELYPFPGVDPAVALVQDVPPGGDLQTVWVRSDGQTAPEVPAELAPYVEMADPTPVSPTPPRAAARGTAPASPGR